ncbi:hypothetical protein [Endozoicomonas sp. ONNA1]|uniref:hypothetical protein n=1 Tax=Endozoicomonas sp. ONNA1 TaxID=2828740 RepID=UPI0021477AB3|nr:hypothetical protein [Endozoicomonas sp. ONNA1]
MSHSIARLPKTAKQSIFFHRDSANQSVAASFCIIMMACPCSTLLADNLFSTPVEEGFVREKTTKEFSFLNDLINHNAYIGKIPPYDLNPNTSSLIFAMNHENEQDEKKDEHSEESEGAEARQLQPLMEIPLPPMNHAQMTAIIQGLNAGFDEVTLNTMLSYIPVTPPDENLTIANMIQQVIQALGYTLDNSQSLMIAVLTDIRGTESPVDITKTEDQHNLAMLMVSYYIAIHSNEATPQEAHFFFNSFLLHAAGFSGIDRLDTKKDELLGVKEPINDRTVLKENIKKSARLFDGLRLLGEMRLTFLYISEQYSKFKKTRESINPLITAAFSLLNKDVSKSKKMLYHNKSHSAQTMSRLIKKYGEIKPELVASNNQFLSLIDAICLILDPYSIQLANTHIDNLATYFSASNWDDTITHSSEIKDKEQTLFGTFKKVLTDANDNPGNENPELFRELLLALQKYIEQQLQKTFNDFKDCQVIFESLFTGFEDLLRQSRIMLAMPESTLEPDVNEHADGPNLGEAIKDQEGKDFSEKEKKKKHLEERIEHLVEFLDFLYDFSIENIDNMDPDSLYPAACYVLPPSLDEALEDKYYY